MIAQLLAHLWGDYLLQSDWMAQNKTKRNLPAWIHAILYGCCFIPVLRMYGASDKAFAVIIVTHYFIDRFRLTRYLLWAKNLMAPRLRWWWYQFPEKEFWQPEIGWGPFVHPDIHRIDYIKYRESMRRCQPWHYCKQTGYPPEIPLWMSVWLLIIADNTLHLTINYLALRYL